MKRPAIFFDRDNTIIISDGYLGDPEQVELMEGAADAVARARALGFATIIVSNQSGVARGLFSEEDVHAVNYRLDQLLRQANPAAVIDRHEFCPDHPDASVERYRRDSDRRKPRPGMILSAAEKLALDLDRSWIIGDAPRDIEAGKAAGCRTILLKDERISASPAAGETMASMPDCIVSTLGEAMDFVERNMLPPAGVDAPHSAPAPSEPDPQSPPQPAPTIAEAPQLEQLAEQILQELRTLNQRHDYSDFSVSKLMAGIVQVIALATLLLSYFSEGNFVSMILVAIFLQTLTIALLIMGRQK